MITLREGPAAITLPAVAAEMQTSLSSLRRILRSADALPRLGLQWVEARQRSRAFYRWSGELTGSDPLRRAVNGLLRMIPSTEAMADEARVWRALVEAHERQQSWAREARDGHEQNLEVNCLRIAAAVYPDVDAQARELERLRALADGATLRICAGVLSPEEGATLVRRHVVDLLGELISTAGDAA